MCSARGGPPGGVSHHNPIRGPKTGQKECPPCFLQLSPGGRGCPFWPPSWRCFFPACRWRCQAQRQFHPMWSSAKYTEAAATAAPPTLMTSLSSLTAGTAVVSLAGWSVQYTSATGTGNFGSATNLITPLPAVTLQPGQYLLIQEAQGAGGTTPLPAPHVTDLTPINMSGTGGKVVIASTSTGLGCNGSSMPCPPAALALIVDLVGWDGANFFEGSGPAPATTNTTANLRNSNGCAETDNNAADFTVGVPAPRNTASPFSPCTVSLPNLTVNDITLNEGNSGTTAFNFTVSLTSPAGPGGVTFDIATQDNSATVADNDYVANSLIGQTIPAGSSNYSFSVLVNGDTICGAGRDVLRERR